jgi:hypothetical protein
MPVAMTTPQCIRNPHAAFSEFKEAVGGALPDILLWMEKGQLKMAQEVHARIVGAEVSLTR